MYGVVNQTVYGDTEEEIVKIVDQYRTYPMFQGGTVRDAGHMPKWKNWQDKKLMAVISYFQTDDYSGD